MPSPHRVDERGPTVIETATARAIVITMSLRSPAWNAAQRAELAEARARSDAMTLAERTDEAVAMYLLTLVDLAARAADRDEYRSLWMRNEPMPSLRDRWNAIRER